MSSAIRTLLLTSLALVAFAANSILCRLALGAAIIDAMTFTTVRLVSGAAILLVLRAALRRGDSRRTESTGRSSIVGRWAGGWRSASYLSLYAVAFSFAYLRLPTGTGALVLFGSVQATMILQALATGERPLALEWLGLAIALSGLVALVAPGLTAPDPLGVLLMACAGIAWGLYTLRGRSATDPVHATTDAFVRSGVLAVLLSVLLPWEERISARGILLAVCSGAFASGVGYVIWYAALKGLTTTRAATVQLAVPVLAASGGAVFLSEPVTTRLLLAAVMILGGIGLVVASRTRPIPRRATL